MSHPWMPLYVGDYLRDTRRLSAAEHGGYLLLMMEYWTVGNLPNDDDQLARIACMSAQEWRRAKPIIQAFFKDGWKHPRIDAELVKANEVAAKYASRARHAANVRHGKHTSSNASSNASSIQGDMLCGVLDGAQPQSQPHSQESLSSAGAAEECFERFWAAYPKRDGDNPRKKAWESFKRYVLKHGVDVEVIIAATVAYARAMQDRGKVGTVFVPMASTWLNQERWKEYEAAPSAVPQHYSLVDGTPQCEAWRAYYTGNPTPSHQFRLREMASCFAKGAAFPVPQEWPPDHQKQAA